MKLWIFVLIGILAVCSAADKKEEAKENKDKRQVKHTRVLPQQPQQSASLYSSQPDQFIIRSVASPHHSHGHRYGSPQQEQAEETSPEAYAFLQEIQQNQPQKEVQYGKAPPAKGYAVGPQFFPEAPESPGQYRHEQQIQLIPEEHILKILQEELAARGISDLEPKGIPVPYQAPNVGKYRESGPPPTHEPASYAPQTYHQRQPSYHPLTLDYHRSIPNHPLAKSSLEKELEKLIASNKPSHPGYKQHDLYKPQKQEQKAAYSAPSPAPSKPLPSPSSPPKQYSYLPEFSHFENYKAGPLLFEHQYAHPEPQYLIHAQAYQQGPKLIKNPPNNGQYLSEVQQKQQQKNKPNHGPFRPKAQFYIAEEKQPEQESSGQHAGNHNKNSAMKIIDPPNLQYERQSVSSSPAVQQYYKQQSLGKPDHISREPSTSSIFVAQGTGLQPEPEAVIPVKQYQGNGDKVLSLPPQDGRPLTQEEFQQLVDAGYPVQAVPVPVPVPLEKYVKDHPEYYQEEAAAAAAAARQQQSQKLYRPQSKSIHDQRLKVTYLRPLNHQNAKASSS